MPEPVAKDDVLRVLHWLQSSSPEMPLGLSCDHHRHHRHQHVFSLRELFGTPAAECTEAIPILWNNTKLHPAWLVCSSSRVSKASLRLADNWPRMEKSKLNL
uniref:Uncharacterized protein n=1 Tax=Lotharella globosa TaxID=91324 RepID=A0A6U3CMQ4_9EUKA|mmetsp:Transcript_21869/g.42552  ORF Transcript_21869/g.42552 Transcript_21869/m.42552 type:complete len:102 (-) Transcript_21869:452-757(-)